MTEERQVSGAAHRAHQEACAAGRPGYLDPDSGLFVMTADHLRSRGPCCGSGCRHCPWRDDAAGSARRRASRR